MREIISISSVCLFFFSLILLAGCNPSFDPLQENDKYHFSMYGTIDAAADTQWVRIGPARQDINESPDPQGIRVTLEHIQSGKTVTMNDSLVTSKNFLNYWTTMDIENEQTYRITAERDGKSSHVTITTPKEIPSPHMIQNERPRGYNVYIDDTVEHIVDVQSVWYLTFNGDSESIRRIYRYGRREPLKHSGVFGGTYFTFSNHEEELGQIEQSSGNGEVSVERVQFFIAAAGPEWNEEIPGIDDLEYFLNEAASNVENGLGYVVGIDSKWVTQRTCLGPNRVKYVRCTPDDGPFWYQE